MALRCPYYSKLNINSSTQKISSFNVSATVEINKNIDNKYQPQLILNSNIQC